VSVGLPVVRACDLAVAPPDENWLVRDIWGKAAVGIIGGAPKCCKSWLALDLAVSIASNTPCLGHFDVEDPGPALVYLAEDALAHQRARIDALCDHRGLNIAALSLHVITAPALRLDLASDREALHRSVELLKPKILVLDPLVRLHRLDENSAMEISGLLSYLRELQRAHDVAVVLVHHASKKHRARPGQALRGSSDIHAFGDDLAHLTRPNDQELLLTLEHRSAPALDPIRLRLASHKDGGATHLELVDVPPKKQTAERSVQDQIVSTLTAESPRALLRQDLRQRLQINNARLGDVLVALESAGRIVRTSAGWTLPPSPPSPPPVHGAPQAPLFPS